ncbi:MAG: GNAT family N-acetyltransferase [Chloroflexota bacterium]|nr:GNAT family N-acetyltransferase [Chloroflexota bacterium]
MTTHSEGQESRTGEIHGRFATGQDLDFVGQDGFITSEILLRKIEQEEVIIATLDDLPAGYLRLEYLWSLVPYIALIHVQPEYRRRGVGKALLDFAQAFLREQGHTALYSSSQVDEPEPQAWHRHVGFQECGVISEINQGGIGELFFRKEL